MWIAVAALAVICASATGQDVKTIKSGYGGGQYQYHAGDNLIKFFGNHTNNQFGMRHNLTQERNYEVGVCYIEVPTATLAKDPSHIPAGNGSRSDLSRIRTCCHGYVRNIHNYKICDPVCTKECVNALCSAPETCTCFPDHIKNLAGFCVPTCPIGCQNGHCDGGVCKCKEGFRLATDGKFCMPYCKEGCNSIGNCTGPNTCECKPGYESTPDGSCKPVCKECVNGKCIAPNQCTCNDGHTLQNGHCTPHCPRGCGPNIRCIAPNVCEQPPTTTSTTSRPGYGVIPLHQQEYGRNNTLYPNLPLNQYNQNPNYPYPNTNPNYPHPNSPNRGDVPSQPTTPEPYYPGRGDVPAQNPNYPYPGDVQSVQSLDVQQTQNLNIPQCREPCINGVCGDNNRCVCNPGYVPDRSDATESRCLPHCPGGCQNGICSAPNFCICSFGYVKDRTVKGSSTCVKRAKRSLDEEKLESVADLLEYIIPEGQ